MTVKIVNGILTLHFLVTYEVFRVCVVGRIMGSNH